MVNAKIKDLTKTYDDFVPGGANMVYGVSYVIDNDSLNIKSNGEESDVEALAKPAIGQMYDIIQRKARELSAYTKGIGQNYNWNALEAATDRLCENLEGPLEDIPGNILRLHAEVLELAGFVEEHNELKLAPSGNKGPLPPHAARALQNLINSLAPWVREFPTALEQDHKIGDALARPELFEPSKIIFEQAGTNGLLNREDQQILLNLIDALNRKGPLAAKTGALGQGSAYNLIIKVISLPVIFYAGATANAFGKESIIVKKAVNMLLKAESQVLEIMADAPEDIRISVENLLNNLKNRPKDIPPPPSPKAIEPSSRKQDKP